MIPRERINRSPDDDTDLAHEGDRPEEQFFALIRQWLHNYDTDERFKARPVRALLELFHSAPEVPREPNPKHCPTVQAETSVSWLPCIQPCCAPLVSLADPRVAMNVPMPPERDATLEWQEVLDRFMPTEDEAPLNRSELSEELRAAAHHGDLSVVRDLLDHGAHPAEGDGQGFVAIRYAVTKAR